VARHPREVSQKDIGCGVRAYQIPAWRDLGGSGVINYQKDAPTTWPSATPRIKPDGHRRPLVRSLSLEPAGGSRKTCSRRSTADVRLKRSKLLDMNVLSSGANGGGLSEQNAE
jgi:hypothetical protein